MNGERVVPASRLREVEEQRNRLHKALSEGFGVEDGGIWEDRALAAEQRVRELEAALEAIGDVVHDPLDEDLVFEAALYPTEQTGEKP